MKTGYCRSFFNYHRCETSSVKIGNLYIGDNNPIVAQSMTNTETRNISETVDQCKRIFDNGAGLVRITIPSVKDVENLSLIRQKLFSEGYKGPLSADVHFSSIIAEEAAKVVDKVRINPGNFVRSTGMVSSDDNIALDQIRESLIRLINICKENKTALRIGTNHGSLSERILQKHGDTPEGMVESTLEFLRICKEENFSNVVISLKSSNVKVMVYANRLLIREMKKEGITFPIHLGVTEAGEGEDGRIKSAIGIGSLLQDGIGDTIRVSLTEDPENEINVCDSIINYYFDRTNEQLFEDIIYPQLEFYSYKKLKSHSVINTGGDNKPVVIADLSNNCINEDDFFQKLGSPDSDRYPDFIYLGSRSCNPDRIYNAPLIFDYKSFSVEFFSEGNKYALLSADDYLKSDQNDNIPRFLTLKMCDLKEDLLNKIRRDLNLIIFGNSSGNNYTAELRSLTLKLKSSGCFAPVINVFDTEVKNNVEVVASCSMGPLFIDGLSDGIIIRSKEMIGSEISVAFGILQATRARITKTEYISCPGCGRTLFNLQSISEKIRERTSHLKGLKIGIMGCIVNGPGEMADADFGYVGSLKGKVTLYKGKTPVHKNIPEKNAVETLIELIKDNNMWQDPV